MTRPRFTLMYCGAAVLTVMAGARAGAQITRESRPGPQPCTDAPRFLFPHPYAATRKLAAEAQVALRHQLGAKYSKKDICVIAKSEADDMLRSSGFATDTAMTILNAHMLATAMRADEFILTEVTSGSGGVKYSGRLFLGRQQDVWARDNIPDVPGSDRGASYAAASFVEEGLKKVRAQLPFESKCYVLRRDGRPADAATQARLGIAAYPEAVISRLCLADALFEQDTRSDEVVKVVGEVLQRDPDNMRALVRGMKSYFAKADTAKFSEFAGRIVAADPTHPEVEPIIVTLTEWKKTPVALGYIERVLATDPENTKILEIQFRLLYNQESWKDAAAKGEVLAPLDTAYVDTAFVQRMVSAYYNDSMPDKVLEWLTKGTQKFPKDAGLASRRAQQLKRIGKTEEAIAELKRLLGLQTTPGNTRLFIAQYYDELRQPDSTMAWLRRAGEAGENKEQAGGVAFTIALRQFQAAQAIPKDSIQQAVAAYKALIPQMAFADSLFSDDKPKFYWGFAAYKIAEAGYQQIAKLGDRPTPAACPIAKEAQPWLEVANDKILAGGRAQQETAAALFGQIPQLRDYFSQIISGLRCT